MHANERSQRLLDILVDESLRFGEFQLASGATSDYYIDGKYTTLHPEGVLQIAHLMLDRLDSLGLDAVGGVTLGGDPIVGAMAAVSHERGKPLHAFIIRKQSKDHGTMRMIEGYELTPGSKVAVVEDVVSTGGSALRAIDSVEETGAKVTHVLSVVDRVMGADEAFEERGIDYSALFSKEQLLDRAEERGLRPSVK